MAPNAIEHENHFEFEPPIQLISIEKDAEGREVLELDNDALDKLREIHT